MVRIKIIFKKNKAHIKKKKGNKLLTYRFPSLSKLWEIVKEDRGA